MSSPNSTLQTPTLGKVPRLLWDLAVTETDTKWQDVTEEHVLSIYVDIYLGMSVSFTQTGAGILHGYRITFGTLYPADLCSFCVVLGHVVWQYPRPLVPSSEGWYNLTHSTRKELCCLFNQSVPTQSAKEKTLTWVMWHHTISVHWSISLCVYTLGYDVDSFSSEGSTHI